MTVKNDTVKADKTLVQLKRIRGQIDGIINMYEDERSCVDIVRQVIAASNSLRTVARGLLTEEAGRCSRERKIEELESVLKEVFKY
jgi:DNA-binding FrmR family transcriptional regulator